MDTRELGLSALMVFSAVMLTYKWLSLYNKADPGVIFFAFLLTLALGGLFISMEMRMRRVMEEFENTKRVIAVNADDLEVRFEGILQANLKQFDERLESIERRLYR
ncbi:MAG: hypothetical protein H0Z28_05500 [Archaeoglobus sp.]|nr:hypothetical protein [Archaeoglobus sp.]